MFAKNVKPAWINNVNHGDHYAETRGCIFIDGQSCFSQFDFNIGSYLRLQQLASR